MTAREKTLEETARDRAAEAAARQRHAYGGLCSPNCPICTAAREESETSESLEDLVARVAPGFVLEESNPTRGTWLLRCPAGHALSRNLGDPLDVCPLCVGGDGA